jgi:outer membrane protein assembly factor BamB
MMSPVTVPHGDLSRTGQCPGPGIVREPKVFRRFTTNAGRPSLPAVADGVMYAGDAEGNLYAFDVETGERLWYHQHHDDRYSMRIERMSAVTPDLVIIEAGGRVFGHARLDGEVRWKIEGTCPTVVDDILLVLDDLSGIQAFDAASGQLRWRTGQRFDGGSYGLLQAHPTIADGMVLVAEGFEGHHTHGGLHAFDRRTGTLQWGIGEGEVACARLPPCDAPDELMVAPFHPVWAHGLVWTIQVRQHEGSGEGELVGIDPKTGKQHRALVEGWLDADEFIDGAPIFGPEWAYCRSESRVDALDLATGVIQWTQRLAAPIVGTPLLAGGTLHLATDNGCMHAIDATTGDLQWSLTLDEPTGWSMAFSGEGEYDEIETPFTLANGTLFARVHNAVLALR